VDRVRDWIAERVQADEDLSRDALAELATGLGREDALWRELVRHDPDQRVYVELYRDVHLDIWLICWNDLQDTGFHDHDTSSGAVYVSDGELVEDRFEFGEGGIRQVAHTRAAGTVFDFDAARIHCVRHPGGPQPAVSIHCYSPALWRMGFYSFDDAGNLSRASVTYADEMWARPSGLADLRA
jgi:hypothetical protein